MRGSAVEYAAFLERGKRVCGQHLRPFVAVVAGRISAGEDMPEAVGKPVPVRHGHNGDFRPHGRQDLEHAPAPCGIVFGVQPEIEQRELELPHHLQAGMEAARRDQFRLSLGRQRGARLDMARDPPQHVGVPRVVLEELAWQFDRIPRHPVDAGDARIVDPRQKMMQPVAELVKQREHIVMRQERRPVLIRRQEIAD